MENKLSHYTKTIVSLLVFAFAFIALFFGDNIFGFHVTDDFKQQAIALIPLAAGVVAVFGTKNATPDAIDKAVMQLVTGAVSLATFFTAVPSDLTVKIGAIVYAAVGAYFVWKAPNTPSANAQ